MERLEVDGAAYWRGDPGYEAARRAVSWNARVPERFPEVIVQASHERDVVAAVRHAATHELRIGIRSGGHSWSVNSVRDGGMLLDVGRLDQVQVDAAGYRAVAGPGCKGSALAEQLGAVDRFFPSGHCRGVAIGGYLLQGGYGWNSRVLGPACESVLGLDVVTADGELVHCDEHSNPELYWAARGAGPGFFGVVTTFHLRLHDKPKVCGSSLYVYPVEVADEVFSWARSISADIDRRVELQIVTSRAIPALGLDTPSIVIASPVFADSEEDAREALAILGSCPVLDRAIIADPFSPAELGAWYDAVMSNYPDDHRWGTDNMWTSASAEELLPGLHRIIETMPPHPSHFLWLGWGPSPERQDMAYSLEDEVYLALYGSWQDPADDERFGDWARSNMEAMSNLASGVQLADENLGERPAPFATDAAMRRLDEVRDRWDPTGRFHPWQGRV